jgi:SEC-C motif-containing protein
LLGKATAKSAEQLMRSRYAAYVHQKIDYLIETTHPATRKLYRRKDIEKWAKESKWLKLDILFSTENFVEFKAYFQDKAGKIQEHHEKSNFIFEGGKWFFE